MTMPHANIWIREDDWELWTAIEKKSEFISEALNQIPDNNKVNQNIKTIDNAIDKVKKVATTNEIKLCKHHSALGLCKYGCK
jgi:hypothetical protein